MSDVRAFGSLIKERRKSLRLSQEAVAALAFGNGDRKGYISSIETGRAKGLRSETARKLATALDLPRDAVPASLRWPDLAGEAAPATASELHLLAEIADQAERIRPVLDLIERWFRQMEARLALSPLQRYQARLGPLLARVARVLGAPFSFQSFCVSVTIAYVYLFFAGLLAYAQGGGGLGSLAIFARPDWAPGVSTALLAATAAVVVAIAAVLAYRWGLVRDGDLPTAGSPRLSRLWRVHRIRVFTGGLVLGMAAVIASALGTDTIAAIMVIAIAGFGSLSRLGAKRAAWAGAIAGALAGGVESLFDDGSLPDVIEGALFGGVLCGVAGLLSGAVARKAPTASIGALMGAGIGAAAGAVATVLTFHALDVSSLNSIVEDTLGNRDFAVLTTADHGLSAILVLWAVLPATNAVLDFISYGVSLKLGHRALRRDARSGSLFLLGVLDLALAVLLSGATLALVYAGLLAADAILAVDLSPRAFFVTWWETPFGSGLWLTVMILSTLSWTFLHYILVVLPALSAAIASRRVHGPTKERIEDEIQRREFSARSYALSFLPLVAYGLVYLLLLTSSLLLLGQVRHLL